MQPTFSVGDPRRYGRFSNLNAGWERPTFTYTLADLMPIGPGPVARALSLAVYGRLLPGV